MNSTALSKNLTCKHTFSLCKTARTYMKILLSWRNLMKITRNLVPSLWIPTFRLKWFHFTFTIYVSFNLADRFTIVSSDSDGITTRYANRCLTDVLLRISEMYYCTPAAGLCRYNWNSSNITFVQKIFVNTSKSNCSGVLVLRKAFNVNF